MRRIVFEEIGMENYGPYIEPMILPIENNKLTLITGPNGVGKSMILDALPFTHFGITSKGARGDDVVNNKVGKGCHTWNTFSIDGMPYRVDRYHKYPKLGNTVHLFKNNEETPYKKGHAEVLPEIERLICPFKLFMNTLLFAQKVKNFFTDLTDTEKKEIFRKILGLDNYTDYYNETTEIRKNKIDEKLNWVNQLSLKNELLLDAKTQIGLLNEEKIQFNLVKKQSLLAYEDLLLKLDNDRQLLIAKIPVIEDGKLDRLNREVNKLENKISILNDDLLKIEQEVETQRKSKEVELKNSSLEAKQKISNNYPTELEKIIISYADKIDKIKQEIKEFEEKHNQINIEVRELDFSKNEMERQKEELNVDALDGVSNCPTCLQPITEESKNIIKNKIYDYLQKIEKLLEQRRKTLLILEEVKHITDNNKFELNNVIQDRDSKQNELKTKNEQEARKIESKLDSLLESLQTLAKKMVDEKIQNIKDEKEKINEDLNLRLNELSEEKLLIEYFKNKEIQIGEIEKEEELTRKLMEERKEWSYIEDSLNSYYAKTKTLQSEIENLNIQMREVIDDLEVLDFWKVGFSSSGIPSLLIDDSIPFMNSTISEYLDQISNGRYTVSFDTLKATKAGEFRDKISVNVLDNFTKANQRVQFSGGQTRVVDIATILTLCDLQSVVQDVSFNLLLFDEIFDSLDDDNTGFVSKVLRSLVRDKAIFIISHTHIDQIEADEILQLK